MGPFLSFSTPSGRLEWTLFSSFTPLREARTGLLSSFLTQQ